MITKEMVEVGRVFRLDGGQGESFGVMELGTYSDGTPSVTSRINGMRTFRDTLDEFVAFLNEEGAIDITEINQYPVYRSCDNCKEQFEVEDDAHETCDTCRELWSRGMNAAFKARSRN